MIQNLLVPVIFLTGLKNSGKNTFGDFLAQELKRRLPWSIRMTAFADPLKRAVQIICGVDPAVLWGTSEVKESTLVYGKSVREILQWLGTDVCRNNLSPDIWINATLHHIQTTTSNEYTEADGLPPGHHGVSAWIVTDCRFLNEWLRPQEVLRSKNIYWPWLIQITRSSCPNTDAHPSETGVADLAKCRPIVISNDETLDELKSKAERVAAYMICQCHYRRPYVPLIPA